MKLISSICLAAALLAAGCSSNNNPVSPGTTGTSDSYVPSSAGSTWTYAGTANYTVTAGGDTTVAGRHYTVMYKTLGGTSLVRHDGASYYSTYGTSTLEILYFKDSTVSTAWSFDLVLPGSTTHYLYAIAEKGITHVVNGKSYTNVVRVHAKTFAVSPIDGSLVLANEGDYYYAKGIGLIQTNLGTAGVFDLVSYSIK
jgi:hypothetical protein